MRSPVRIARAGPSSRATAAGPSSRAPSSTSASPVTRGIERAKTSSASGTPQTTPGSSSSSSARQRASAGHDALGRQVAGADVLGERRRDDAVDGVGGQLHGSSTGALAAAEDDVRRERRVLGREVGAEVARRGSRARASALSRDQPRQERRRAREPLEPLGAADHARVLPERVAERRP